LKNAHNKNKERLDEKDEQRRTKKRNTTTSRAKQYSKRKKHQARVILFFWLEGYNKEKKYLSKEKNKKNAWHQKQEYYNYTCVSLVGKCGVEKHRLLFVVDFCKK